MAIYCRNTGSLSSSLILSCSKYSNVTHKFHALQQWAVTALGDSRRYSDLRNQKRKDTNEEWHGKDIDPPKILDIVDQKKSTAKRSILVHLRTRKDIPELHSMCSRFGDVKYIYQYTTDDNRDVVLLEFQSIRSLQSVTSFFKKKKDSMIHSNVFKFHGSDTKKRSKDDVPLIVLPRKSEQTQLKKLKQIGTEGKSVSAKIQEHYNLMKLNTIDEKLRYFVLCEIERSIASINSDIKAIPFGSTINGFGMYNSDLDLVLINEASQDPDEKIVRKPYLTIAIPHGDDKTGCSRTKLRTSLHLIATVMPRVLPGIINMCEILSARVPIIRFKHQLTGLSCDLTMDQRAGVCMSELLHIFGTFDVRVRPLALFIRDWARLRQLTSSHPSQRITNFSLSLLLIFYFQTIRLLPSLQTLKTYARYCDVMQGDDGESYSFLRRLNLLPPNYLKQSNENLEELLLGFFEYFASFKFDKYSINLETGEPQCHQNFAPLFIHNPLNIELNVSKNVNSIQLGELQKHFQDSAIIMRNINNDTVFNNLLLLNKTTEMKSAGVQTDTDNVKNVKESSECV